MAAPRTATRTATHTPTPTTSTPRAPQDCAEGGESTKTANRPLTARERRAAYNARRAAKRAQSAKLCDPNAAKPTISLVPENSPTLPIDCLTPSQLKLAQDTNCRPEDFAALSITPQNFGDLKNLDTKLLPLLLRFLTLWQAGAYFKPAAAAAQIPTAAVMLAKRRSKTFANLYDAAQDLRRQLTAATMESQLELAASGNAQLHPNCVPPDPRAAQFLLAALDPKFRPSGPQQAVQVNISMGI